LTNKPPFENLQIGIDKMILAEKAQYFCLELPLERHLDFAQIFGNDHPVILEIGSGKGEFISVYSRFYPTENYIGVELKHKRIVNTLKKLDVQKNTNVRLLQKYIDEHITAIIPPASISEVIINHPDPWPKNKHKKNRLIQHGFLDALYQILKAGGQLKISTDDVIYTHWINKIFTKRDDFESMYPGGYTYIVPEYHLQTYFSELKTRQGFRPAFMLYRKKG